MHVTDLIIFVTVELVSNGNSTQIHGRLSFGNIQSQSTTDITGRCEYTKLLFGYAILLQ